MHLIKRRTLLKSAAALSVVGGGCTNNNNAPQPQTGDTYSDDPWLLAQEIVNNTVVPEFPDRVFQLTDYGAVGDGTTDNTQAFKDVIAACFQAGGGKIVVSGGNFLTGPIHLQSNINLHIEQDATISFYTDPSRFLPAVFTRWEGMEMMGYSPLIYAIQKQNVAITGRGTLDGKANRSEWWPWKGNSEWGVEGFPSQAPGRQELMEKVEAGVPPEQRHFSEGYYFRPPFIQPYLCQNVLIEDIKIVNAPFWLLHPTLCENVTVRGVRLESLGPNSDGCDPESCKNVVIENCYFDTGDDCIAIKSGRNADGRRVNVPTENVVIRNCKMRAGHGGVVIGSEISGGVRNVFAENNEMSSPDLERGFRVKTNSIRGGLIERIYLRNCTIGEVQDAIVINFYYEEGDAGKFDPTVRHLEIKNLICGHAKRAFQVRGFDRAPIRDFHIVDTVIKKADEPGIIENVENLVLHNVKINGKDFTV